VEKAPNPIHGRIEIIQITITIVTGFCR